jgi:hypothetical protein
MRKTKARCGGRAEKGSIAVETVLCLPLLILFLVVPLFLARAFWYYSVAQKAAHDGARFLASAAQFEIMPPASIGDARLPVAVLAEAIAHAELQEIKPALERYTITALCDGDACGFEVPNTVRVSVRLKLRDEIFGPFTNEYFGEEALSLEARVTMRYVGN